MNSTLVPWVMEEMSLDVCGTVEELLSLKDKLKGETFRNRVTHHSSLVGGPNPGENPRWVMRAVASYSVWKEFSLKGKKGKRPLLNLTIMKVIKKTVMMSNPRIQQEKVEDIVADTLKHAPARCQNHVIYTGTSTSASTEEENEPAKHISNTSTSTSASTEEEIEPAKHVIYTGTSTSASTEEEIEPAKHISNTGTSTSAFTEEETQTIYTECSEAHTEP
ncbi:unnamed protein product [Leuciscus chuanchicus]